MAEPTRKILSPTPRHISFNPEPELADDRITAPERELWRRLQHQINMIWYNFLDIHNVVSTSNVAYQFTQITAAMLESSDDADGNAVLRSVLITASETDYEFNWLMSGGVRGYKVVLGPGKGVPSHSVIIDKNDKNIDMLRLLAADGVYAATESVVARPYGMSGLKLQFGQWKPDPPVGDVLRFWPSSIAVGTWVYLEQTLPMVNIV